jgi:hypothetical protein
MLSRQQQRTALEHVLSNVFALPTVHPIRDALDRDGIEGIADFLNLTPNDVEELRRSEKDEKGKETLIPLIKGHKNLILVFFDYRQWRVNTCNPIGDDFGSITDKDFDAFRVSPDYMMTRASPIVPLSTGSLPPKSTSTSSATKNFKKGIRRDPTAFPTLKDERYQDSWHKSFTTIARAQDLEELLTDKYIPSTTKQKELFKLKQVYMYSVLYEKVQTPEGKTIVRKYHATSDAQAAYKELLEHHTQSAAADLSARDIHSYLTVTKIGDGKFRGTSVDFIEHFVHQMDLYDTLVGTITDSKQRIIYLSQAVSTVPALALVKTTATIMAKSLKQDLDFSLYLPLLREAATRHDDALKARGRRMVYNHEFGSYNEAPGSYDINVHDNYYDTDTVTYDLETPVSVIEAHATEREQQRRAITIPRDRWMSLDAQGRELWDQLNDKQKATILGLPYLPRSAGPNPSRGRPPPGRQRPPPRQVNMHEFAEPEPP